MHPGARTDVGPPPRFITSEPRLGFGAWAVGGRSWGATDDAAERESTIRLAFERGITFFDTAPTYGDGESERLLGRALRPHRGGVAIATKVGPHDDPRASLEGSLRRLASDYVDLIQLPEARQRWDCSPARTRSHPSSPKTTTGGRSTGSRDRSSSGGAA